MGVAVAARGAGMARRHLRGQPRSSCAVMQIRAKSEYFLNLTAESRTRYQSKITATGLLNDPYAIETSEWTENPENAPDQCPME